MKYIFISLCCFLFYTNRCFAQQTADTSASNNIFYFSLLKQNVASVNYERIFRINRNFTINPHAGTGYITGDDKANIPTDVTLYHGAYFLFGIKNIYIESGVDFVVHDYGKQFYYNVNGNFGLRYQPQGKEYLMLSLTYNPIFYRSEKGNDFDVPYGFSVGLAF